MDISFKAPETSHAVGAAVKTASPMHTAKANNSHNTWNASGVVVVGLAMFAVGVAAGLFSKFINDKNVAKRSKIWRRLVKMIICGAYCTHLGFASTSNAANCRFVGYRCIVQKQKDYIYIYIIMI